jgi:hypothetical protein
MPRPLSGLLLHLGGGRATRQRNQHLPRILEIAPPQQRSTLACEAVRSIGGHGVIGNDHARRRERPALGLPARGTRLTILGPVNRRKFGHG